MKKEKYIVLGESNRYFENNIIYKCFTLAEAKREAQKIKEYDGEDRKEYTIKIAKIV